MVLCARIAIFLFSTACATKQVHKVPVLIRHCQIIGEVSHWRNIVRIAKLPLPTVLSGGKVRWVGEAGFEFAWFVNNSFPKHFYISIKRKSFSSPSAGGLVIRVRCGGKWNNPNRESFPSHNIIPSLQHKRRQNLNGFLFSTIIESMNKMTCWPILSTFDHNEYLELSWKKTCLCWQWWGVIGTFSTNSFFIK